MNRAEKQRRLAQTAAALAFDIEHGTKPFFGNEGVTLYRDGSAGDIIGYLITRAGLPVKKFVADVTNPNDALASVLGVATGDLPTKLQAVTNALALAGDDTKRAYSRRIPKLKRLLGEFATEVVVTITAGASLPVLKVGFDLASTIPGKSL